MPHQDGRFKGHDGLELYQQCWLPERESAAVVVLVHGFIEHSGRYADVAKELNRHGYAVYALDLRGHGQSNGERVFVRSFDEFAADLDIFLQEVKRRESGKAIFLLGHSMGGTIAARLAVTRQPDVAGMVLSAPAVRVGKGVFPLLRRGARLVSRLFPRLRVVRLGSGWISRDPQVVADFRQDPLVFHEKFTVRIGAEILDAAQHLQDHAPSLRLPLLILQGTADRIVDPTGSRLLHDRAGSTDKTLRIYEGLYHDLLHEPEKEQVTANMTEWLDRRCVNKS
ncbi:MAG TPA: lysophospholipase [Thermoguttaceae bacterium]|nr:lysophospholipase [Thermoguttaceae bacterium]